MSRKVSEAIDCIEMEQPSMLSMSDVLRLKKLVPKLQELSPRKVTPFQVVPAGCSEAAGNSRYERLVMYTLSQEQSVSIYEEGEKLIIRGRIYEYSISIEFPKHHQGSFVERTLDARNLVMGWVLGMGFSIISQEEYDAAKAVNG